MNLKDLQSIGSCDPLPTTLGPAIRKESQAVSQPSTRIAPGVVQDANGRMRTFDPSTIYNYRHSDVRASAIGKYIVVMAVRINDRKFDDKFDAVGLTDTYISTTLTKTVEPPPHPANDLEIL